MDITISGKNMETGDALKQHVQDSILAMVEKIF